jgi:hypothetical protein
MTATGPSAYVLRVLDVGASIDLDRAASVLGGRASRGPSTLRGAEGPGPSGVRLATAPVDVAAGSFAVGELAGDSRVRLFEFGVASVRFRIDLEGATPAAMVAISARAGDDRRFDEAARATWDALVAELGAAVTPGTAVDVLEDFTVLVLPAPPAAGPEGDQIIARILLGEDASDVLAPELVREMTTHPIRYFADDAVYVAFDAAVVIDRGLGTDVVDLFEVATAHLLELRYYDARMALASRAVAEDVALASSSPFSLRSPFTAAAERAVGVVLELTELTDKLEHVIAVLGDAHSVQVYRAAAARFRIPEATVALRQKLDAVARSAEVLNGHVQTRRGQLLEMLVVALVLVEMVLALMRH